MKQIRVIIRELWLAVVLIAGASALLLVSDWGQRTGASSGKRDYPVIALMQITSTPLLDTLVAGIVDRLTEAGRVAPGKTNIRHYNPQADFATANTIVREIIVSDADIVITASTLALQTFSKANVTAQKIHVFGGVTDPYGAGVGITGPEPHMHPPYMAGIGTFQPVTGAFRILHELNPALTRVGVVWNAGEQCSEACMKEAREICPELGIELMAAAVTNTSEVNEAARSLLARGAEAIWIGGDTVATAAAGLLVSLARQAGIPVFTNDPADVGIGALFGLGANYYTVGQYTADIAGAILNGKNPAEFPIENVVPELLALNREVLASLGPAYRLTPAIEAKLSEGGRP